MNIVQISTFSVLGLALIYIFYTNYRSLNKLRLIESKIQVLEKEFYGLDRRLSENTYNNPVVNNTGNPIQYEDMVTNEAHDSNHLVNPNMPINPATENLADNSTDVNQEQTEPVDNDCITNVLNSELKEEFNQYIMNNGDYDSSDDGIELQDIHSEELESNHLQENNESNIEERTENNLENNAKNNAENYPQLDQVDTFGVENIDISTEGITFKDSIELTDTELELGQEISNQILNGLDGLDDLDELNGTDELNETLNDNSVPSSNCEDNILLNLLNGNKEQVFSNTSDMDKVTVSQLKNMTVKQLRNIARENNLLLKGKKNDLISRITAQVLNS